MPSYVGVHLTQESRARLLEAMQPHLPEDWEVIAHHMTVCMGDLDVAQRCASVPPISPSHKGRQSERDEFGRGSQAIVALLRPSGGGVMPVHDMRYCRQCLLYDRSPIPTPHATSFEMQ